MDTTIDFLTPFLSGKPYHMVKSGYEQIIRYFRDGTVFYVGDFPRLSKFTYPLRLSRLIPKDYSSLHAELAALNSNGLLLHHIYGEDTVCLSFLGRFWKHRSIVATLHRPPSILNATMPVYWKKRIRKLAGVIVLSPVQLRHMKTILRDKGKVSLIPHGIDVDYFTPSSNEKSRDLILSVGNYLRDHQVLAEAMRLVSKAAPKLQLIVISRMPIRTAENIVYRKDVSDLELLDYYRKASFTILSITDLAASNAMLEAMASGLPVICPYLESSEFYLGENSSIFYKIGDPNDLATRILWLYENDRERRRLSFEMRRRAEHFSWSRISGLVHGFYESVA